MLAIAMVLGLLGAVAMVGGGGSAETDDDDLPDTEGGPDSDDDPGIVTDLIDTPDPVTDPEPTPTPTPTPAPTPAPTPEPTPEPTPAPESVPVDGTTSEDEIVGTDAAEVIVTLGGHDIVYGFGGDDYIDLGPGWDAVVQRSYGGDQTWAEFEGNDTLLGGTWDDELRDFIGANEIYGGDDDDTLDAIDAVPGAGVSEGPNVADVLDGGTGNDYLQGDNGDTMTGGEGYDRFFVRSEAVLVPGTDVYDYLDEPVIITDFDAQSEHLMLDFLWEGQLGTFQVSDIDQRVEGSNLILSLQGQDLVVLQNVTAPLPTDQTRFSILSR